MLDTSMPDTLLHFERIVRRSVEMTDEPTQMAEWTHPFEQRSIHGRLPTVVRELFDDGYFAQSTFEAAKFLDHEVRRISGSSASGYKLMANVFAEKSPRIRLTPLRTVTDKDEQKGYQFLFSGSVLAIRNPRGHEVAVPDSPDECLDHLSLVSLLLRRLYTAANKAAH